jgi:hypothetical protein
MRRSDDGVGACRSAQNTGLKEFRSKPIGETNATLATAWNMLQRNTSITILDLRKANCEVNADTDSEMCSAVAKGLVENSTPETLLPPDDGNSIVLHGPVWQEMLESNRCLKSFVYILFHFTGSL